MEFRGNEKIKLDAPCKLNLMLAVTGVRGDGFHNLVSLVVPVNFCDELEAETVPGENEDRLVCNVPELPCGPENLVMKAGALFREAVPGMPALVWKLHKRVPHGAGLGGGSSDAAAALKILNGFCGNAVSAETLSAMAAKLGSDVPLFLSGKPVVMRGRGERVLELSETQAAALRERRFLIFKPAFSIPTAEIYGKMRRERRFYVDENFAEERLRVWLENPKETPPYFNNMEQAVFEKYIALPAMFDLLRERFGLDARMSGSGSACFAEISDETALPEITAAIRESWGATACVRLVKAI